MTSAPAIVFVVAISLAVLWSAWAFNRLIRYRNRTRSGWSDIDVQLQRRHDLIPQLVDAVSGYARFEQATLTAVTELRRLSNHAEHLADKAAVEDQVADFAKQLIAVAEAYPDLKANQNFLSLQLELTKTEDALQYARRFFNGAVREFNTYLESFPDQIVARLFRFKAREFFKAEAGASAPVEVKLSQ
jgi:LemA protein